MLTGFQSEKKIKILTFSLYHSGNFPVFLLDFFVHIPSWLHSSSPLHRSNKHSCSQLPRTYNSAYSQMAKAQRKIVEKVETLQICENSCLPFLESSTHLSHTMIFSSISKMITNCSWIWEASILSLIDKTTPLFSRGVIDGTLVVSYKRYCMHLFLFSVS